MNKIIFAISIMLIATSANASRYHYYNDSKVVTNLNQKITNASSSRQHQKSVSSSSSSSQASSGSSSQSGDSSVAFSQQIPRNPVSSAFAPPAYTRVPCGRTAGFAYQGVNGAASLGIPLPNNRDCEHDNDAAFLLASGFGPAAVRSKCQTRSMRIAHGGGEKTKDAQIERCVSSFSFAQPAIVEQGLQEHEHPQYDEKIDRAFQRRQEK